MWTLTPEETHKLWGFYHTLGNGTLRLFAFHFLHETLRLLYDSPFAVVKSMFFTVILWIVGAVK